MDSKVNTQKYLNNILEKTYDAQRGYANAAEVTDHVDLKRWFAQQGAKRTQYAASLTSEMKGMKEKPEFDGSVTGDMHRGWMNLKAAFSSNKDETILEECLRGEKSAVEEYSEVLEHSKEMPQTVVTILTAQKDEIQSTINQIKRLEDIAEHLND
ncbi:ferritin-like domain-containing protein [Nonlabens antarcticus]|uniref:ferritin-like domain-containing protein n=1 Tax=Nonlabens antarcticus TaxID=392714 RepID=UPI0018910FE8|nr:PA2169 family four-helix-bundle protein [Nonlabens antarcticus]